MSAHCIMSPFRLPFAEEDRCRFPNSFTVSSLIFILRFSLQRGKERLDNRLTLTVATGVNISPEGTTTMKPRRQRNLLGKDPVGIGRT